MKAAEVLQRYANGERDFRGANLRGQNFRGQDLSGADFRGADIRGTNFTRAMLKNTDFSNAQAGLSHYQVFLWIVVTLVLGSLFCTFAAVIFEFFLERLATLIGISEKAGEYMGACLLVAFGAIALQKGILAAYGVAVSASLVVGVGTVTFIEPETLTVPGAVAVTATAIVVGIVVITIAMEVMGFTTGVTVVCVAAATGAIVGAFLGSGPVTVMGIISVNTLSIRLSWRTLQGDSRETWVAAVVIAVAAIGGTSFRCAHLANANFSYAKLRQTDLRHAILVHTNWNQATKLDRARTAGTILLNPTVRDLLVSRRGQGQSYVGCSLKDTNLVGVNLSDADLTEADLSQATLAEAWLERTNLTKVRALGTDFYQTRLTGACLEAWNIDSTTKLDGAICDYVYLLNGQQERRPNSGTFEPGEFTKLFEEVLDTIDLIFRNGLDWKAFVTALSNVQQEHDSNEIGLQSIENKGEGVIVVRLHTDPDADKGKIHQAMMMEYDIAVKAIEEKYRAQLQAKDSEIEIYRRQSADLMQIAKLQASRPITVEAKAVVEQNENKSENKTNLSIGSMAGAINTGSGSASADHLTQNVTNTESKQTLAEAAADIQALLKQLEQSYPANSMTEKMTMATEAIAQIEKDPSLKQKAVNALVAGGTKALEAAIDHPVAAFVVGAIEEWQGS